VRKSEEKEAVVEPPDGDSGKDRAKKKVNSEGTWRGERNSHSVLSENTRKQHVDGKGVVLRI